MKTSQILQWCGALAAEAPTLQEAEGLLGIERRRLGPRTIELNPVDPRFEAIQIEVSPAGLWSGLSVTLRADEKLEREQLRKRFGDPRQVPRPIDLHDPSFVNEITIFDWRERTLLLGVLHRPFGAETSVVHVHSLLLRRLSEADAREWREAAAVPGDVSA